MDTRRTGHFVTSSQLLALAFALTIVAAIYLALADTYSGETCSASSSGAAFTCTRDGMTLLEANGDWVLAYLALPVAVTLAGIATARVNGPKAILWGLSGLLLTVSLLGIFSIGAWYLPVAVLMLIATAWYPELRTGAGQTSTPDSLA